MSIKPVYQDFAGQLVIKHVEGYELLSDGAREIKPSRQQSVLGRVYDYYDGVKLHQQFKLVQSCKTTTFKILSQITAFDLTNANTNTYRYDIGSDMLFIIPNSTEGGDSPVFEHQLQVACNDCLPPVSINGLVRVPANQETVCFLSARGDVVAEYPITQFIQQNELTLHFEEQDFDLRLFYFHSEAQLASLGGEITMIAGLRVRGSQRGYFRPDGGAFLAIGHRGCGSCARHCFGSAGIQENSILSFNTAYEKGADYVETDLILTKNGQIVVNHDFAVRSGDISVPICQISAEQFKAVDTRKYNDFKVQPASYQARCTLQELLAGVSAGCGLNLEVKYPSRACGNVGRAYFSRVEVVQQVMAELQDAGRDVYFSSFDFAVCWLLASCQNRHPVLFLHANGEIGDAADDVNYGFREARELEYACELCRAQGIPGLVLSREDVTRNQRLVQLEAASVTIFTYGTERQDRDFIDLQVGLGVSGIILDLLDQ